MDEAWQARPNEVEEQWIPYAMEMLAHWPHHIRESPMGDESPFDDNIGEHPLYQLVALERFEDLRQDDMGGTLRYAQHAHIEGLVSFELDSMKDVTQENLAKILTGLSRAPLEHLGLTYMEVDDKWIPTIKAAPLPDLTFLDLGGQKMSSQGILELAQTPYLQHLRHMHFGDVPDTHTPNIQTQIKLMDALPNLVTTMAPHNARPWYEIKPTWQDEAQPQPKSVQERVNAALSVYRQQNDTEYPFLGASFGCFGDLIELSDAQFDDPDATLKDVYEAYEDIALDTNMDITTIYVLAIRQGALDEAFDEAGNLLTTLEFRAFGHSWRDGPNGQREGYNGEYFAQSWFANWQLFLEFGKNSTLRLSPVPPSTKPDLLRFIAAVSAAQNWVGGWHLDYYCSPWLEPLNGTDFSVDMRCMIEWEEEEHAFDQHGQLKACGQEINIWGDAVPLLRVLKDFGFSGAISYGDKVLIKRI